MTLFISVQKKREWIATAVASAFFIFFWVHGPIQNTLDEVFQLEHEENYVKPILINDQKEDHFYESKEVGEMETSGEGYALVLDKNDPKETSGIIEFEESAVSNSEYGDEMKLNAQSHFNQPIQHIELKQTEAFYYVDLTSEGNRYLYFQTKGLTNHIKGYSGPINLGIYVRDDAKIDHINLISSNETQSYLQKIARTNYYEQYQNKDLTKSYQIDAVSGATISTKAMAATTSELISVVNPNPIEDLSDRMGISDFQISAALTFKWVIQIVLVFILFLYAYQKKFKKSKRSVLIVSIASVLYIGFFLNESFTYVTFIHPFIGTALSSFMGLYAFFVLLGAIWGKNTYCKHICPYGNIQRLQLKLTKGLNKKFFLSNERIKQVRFAILFFLIVGILAGARNLSHLEPFPYIFGLEVKSVWYFIFAVLGLLMNWVYPMIWCRLLCPTGSLLDTIQVVTTKKIKYGKK